MKKPEQPLHDYPGQISGGAEVRVGDPLPMGTHENGAGVNFAFFSRHASRVWLQLFERPADATPFRVIALDPAINRTGDVWHVCVEGIRPGQLYAYRVDGPYQPREGHRYNLHKLLLDPFATAISRMPSWDFRPARGYDPSAPEQDLIFSSLDNAGAMPKCMFTQKDFDWQGVRPPRHSWSKTVIYETHVRGFTIHPSSGAENPGTYRGLVEKIPYLKDLGVTVVELMSVQEFNVNQATAPQDLFTAGEEPLCEPSQAYHLSPRSSAILLARKTSHQKPQTPVTEAKGPIPLVSSDLQE
jgi:isoamylase